MSGSAPMRPNGFAPITSPPGLVLRVGFAVVGGLGLLFGAIAVFRTANSAGATALLVVGLLLVLAAVVWPLGGATRLGRGVRSSTSGALVGLLESSDPQVRLAAAEAVLGPPSTDPRVVRADLRELALGVLLDRDLVRRLADLLRHSGRRVASDAVGSASHTPAADVLLQLDGDVQLPVVVNPGADAAPAAVLHRLAQVAARHGSRSAVLVFTGSGGGPLPLPSTTVIGDVSVFTAYSPRLGDEVTVLAAVSQAVAQAVSEAGPPARGASPATNGSAHVSEEAQPA